MCRPSRSPFPRPLVRPGQLGPRASSAVALLVLAGGAAAQGPFHVSTSSDVAAGGFATIDDASVVTAGRAGGALPYFVEGHWQAVAGWIPGDVDAVGRDPDATPGSAASLVFSLQSNEGGFLDGDVLSFAPGGGLEVVVSEDDLLNVLGIPGGNVDVDALDFSIDGCLYLSFQSDVSGTLLGNLSDGDVLCFDPTWGTVSVALTEADVQAKFTAATGLVAAIGDVIALDHHLGELWVVPQSPSSHDGAVLSCGGAPLIVMDEATMGIGGAEIDGLAVATPPEEIPCFALDVQRAAPGDTVSLDLYGDPGTVYVALLAGGTGWIDFSRQAGFGAIYLDPLDPWLNTQLGQSGPYYAVTDATGRFSSSWALPMGNVYGAGFLGELGWSFQVFELPSLELSAPFRIQKP